jgi:hypothetical protein
LRPGGADGQVAEITGKIICGPRLGLGMLIVYT